MTLLLLAGLGLAAQAPITLAPGNVITRTMKVKLGTYRFPSAEGSMSAGAETIPAFIPALTIKGDGITVDFSGAALEGTPQNTPPDHRKGLALLVEGNNVTIKNLKVRGFKVAILARNSKGLKVLDSNLSYNWKAHLQSTPEKEDLSDWMSFHQNEHDEWLRYGAAIYLRGCEGFEVKGVTAEGGQCGLMMTDCYHGTVWNNDFSFLSGIGVGMYRSSENKVMHNRIDWCVRGHSEGVYNRGQDSAGILVYEQSDHNTIAFNSVTHGGDGFFLWAGQTTMDSGQGGCNDNLVYGNDFSHAPTNGIEATFSRNNFVNNRVLECWHGVWAGYSYDSKLLGNVFAYNGEAVAWEHGQNNEISWSIFHRDNQAIHLWANKNEDANWGYPQHRDTASHGYKIDVNRFDNETTSAIWLENTADVSLTRNAFRRNGRLFRLDGVVSGITLSTNTIFALPETLPAGAKVEDSPVSNEGSEAQQPEAQVMQANGLLVPDPNQSRAEYLEQFTLAWNGFDGTSRGFDLGLTAQLKAELKKYAPQPLAGGIDPFIPEGATRGRRYILVDEWGSYDFKSPKLWPRGKSDEAEFSRARSGRKKEATSSLLKLRSEKVGGGSVPAFSEKVGGGSVPPFPSTVGGRTPDNATPPVKEGVEVRKFEVLGPKGNWRLKSISAGAEVTPTQGKVGDEVYVKLGPGSLHDLQIQLVYTGEATTDSWGRTTPKGRPVSFGYEHFFLPIDWSVKFYRWSKPSNPADIHSAPEEGALQQAINGEPIKSVQTDSLDFAGSVFLAGLPADHFCTVANGRFDVPEGRYRVDLTTDDGARVWLDGKPLITDAWHYQGPTQYTAAVALKKGRHTLKVEHFQIDGYAALIVVVTAVPKLGE